MAAVFERGLKSCFVFQHLELHYLRCASLSLEYISFLSTGQMTNHLICVRLAFLPRAFAYPTLEKAQNLQFVTMPILYHLAGVFFRL